MSGRRIINNIIQPSSDNSSGPEWISSVELEGIESSQTVQWNDEEMLLAAIKYALQ